MNKKNKIGLLSWWSLGGLGLLLMAPGLVIIWKSILFGSRFPADIVLVSIVLFFFGTVFLLTHLSTKESRF